MKSTAIALTLSLAMIGCGTTLNATAEESQAKGGPQVNIAKLSDEFDGSGTLANWKHIDQTEGWNADQLAKCETENGQLVLMPHTSTWYMDYRGVLVYKDIPGNFVVTTKIRVTGRDGQSAPGSLYSLGGLMLRTPRQDNAQTWQPGGENYVFLSIGAADPAGQYKFEVKTTERSQSNLETTDTSSGETMLRAVRIGGHVILLRNQGSGWVVHKRYYRPDMPRQIQAGLTVYTDYPSASQLGARAHNGTAIQSGNPDLVAQFDFVRFRRPSVPAGFDPGQASDSELIKVIG